jgi:hypothetical protein
MNRISHQNFLNKNETNSKMERTPYTNHTKTLYKYAAGRISKASFASQVSPASHLSDKSFTEISPSGLLLVMFDRKRPIRRIDIKTPVKPIDVAKSSMSVFFIWILRITSVLL